MAERRTAERPGKSKDSWPTVPIASASGPVIL